MEFVKKRKRVLGSSKRLHPEKSGSGSYGSLSRSKKKVPPGFLSVYVGAERERFVIKVKIANHPLFKALLDAADREYGYRNDGPLWLPCDVDLFCEALKEMESTQQKQLGSVLSLLSCGSQFQAKPLISFLYVDILYHHYETLVNELKQIQIRQKRPSYCLCI